MTNIFYILSRKLYIFHASYLFEPFGENLFSMPKCLYPKLWDVHPKPWYVYPKLWYIHPKAWDIKHEA